jgi:uncharacterized membrane protein
MRRVTFSVPWPLTGIETRDVLSFAFQTALVSYLGFFLIENIKPGSVTGYMDLNWWLWAAVVTGVLSAIWPYVVPEAKRKAENIGWREYLWLSLIAITTVAVMWYKLGSLGTIGKVIAGLSGAVVFSLCLLVYYDRDETKD